MDADSDDDDNHAISNIAAGIGEVGMNTDVDMTIAESPSVSPFFQDDYIERTIPYRTDGPHPRGIGSHLRGRQSATRFSSARCNDTKRRSFPRRNDT